MENLVLAYRINEEDRQQRYRLKDRLLSRYDRDLLFTTYDPQSPQVVVSRTCLEKHSLSKAIEISTRHIIKQAGVLIRDAVKDTIRNAQPLPWPPTV